MALLGGPNGYIENDNDYLLLVFTNTEVGSEEEFGKWWSEEFSDIDSVEGLSAPLRLTRDKDQRPGHCPYWKYMTAFGFSGDVQKMKAVIENHEQVRGDTAIWFFEAFYHIFNKEWDPNATEEHIFMALTNPVPGKEDEYNEWYNIHHVHDIVEVPCYMSGRRFHLIDSKGVAPYQYIAFYRFVGSEVEMNECLVQDIMHRQIAETDAYELNDLAWAYSAIE